MYYTLYTAYSTYYVLQIIYCILVILHIMYYIFSFYYLLHIIFISRQNLSTPTGISTLLQYRTLFSFILPPIFFWIHSFLLSFFIFISFCYTTLSLFIKFVNFLPTSEYPKRYFNYSVVVCFYDKIQDIYES